MKHMSSRERMLVALNHKEPDFVPNVPRMAAWMMDYYGTVSTEIILKAAEEFDFDPLIETSLGVPNFIYSQMGPYEEIPDVEVDLHISSNSDKVVRCRRTIHTPAGKMQDEMVYPPAGEIYGISPNPEKCEYMIKDESDLEKVKYLLPDPYKYSNSSFKSMKELVGDRGLVQLRPHIGLDHFMVDSLGLENSMIAYYQDKPMLQKLLDMFGEYYRRCIKRALEHEPEIIIDGWYNCSLSAGWSPTIWTEMFLPQMKANREMVRSAGAYYHIYDDGNIMGVLPGFRELSPDILSTICPPPTGDADLPKVKAELGDRVCINGYVDLQTILRGTPEEVDAEVKYAIETAGPGGGFWLGTSDSMRNGSPVENVRAYCQAARKYGKYPV